MGRVDLRASSRSTASHGRRFGDLYGRRKVFGTGVALFTLGQSGADSHPTFDI